MSRKFSLLLFTAAFLLLSPAAMADGVAKSSGMASAMLPNVPTVPPELYKEWPILAVLAGVVFFMCSLIGLMVLWFGRIQLKTVKAVAELTAAVNNLVMLCHAKRGKLPPTNPVKEGEEQ